MAATIFLTSWEEKERQLKKRGYSQWIKDETEKSAAMKFTAIPLLCCSVFFCWHSEQREQAAFFIGHMPLLNDLWTQGLFWLILLSTHYVAQPSMAIWGGKRKHSPLTLFISIYPLTHSAVYSLFPLLLHPVWIISTMTESLLKICVKHERSAGIKCFYTVLTKLASLHRLLPFCHIIVDIFRWKIKNLVFISIYFIMNLLEIRIFKSCFCQTDVSSIVFLCCTSTAN